MLPAKTPRPPSIPVSSEVRKAMNAIVRLVETIALYLLMNGAVWSITPLVRDADKTGPHFSYRSQRRPFIGKNPSCIFFS